jgi:hypothetical protein
MLNVEKVMTEILLTLMKVTDKSANCEERKMDFLNKQTSKWSNRLLNEFL